MRCVDTGKTCGHTSEGTARDGRLGQTMLEYVVVLVVFLGLTAVLSLLLYAIRQNGVRVLDLVSSEYP